MKSGDGMCARLNILLVMGVIATVFLSPTATAKEQCYLDAISAYEQLIKKPRTKPININTATASDFASLQGVGVATAERIIKYRTQIRRFERVDDLMQVKGIGQAILDKNRHRLSVLD
ncbi:ComEA family DNA-binding protein [Moraxella haemolytica]|uniref:ComEA family DNA-binding protein n=1 Tax=Moraxella TaxID=475 RepID=UPI002542CC06|nr:ComEA family DNA-binding protein [Moraxella sp. ZY171148]WII95201.1 ComEA family DNA-binding protein [Moraxella sp. ZY171148]